MCIKSEVMVYETVAESRYYYQSVVRPVLEYVCPCWHSSLTKEQTTQLEDVQRRALQVIFGNICLLYTSDAADE